jgi:hypothetical protein
MKEVLIGFLLYILYDSYMRSKTTAAANTGVTRAEFTALNTKVGNISSGGAVDLTGVLNRLGAVETRLVVLEQGSFS